MTRDPCDPVRPETRDPGIRVAGGTAYGGIYMGVIWLYRPTRAGVNMARGVEVVELYGLTHRLHLFTHRHCISLYIKIKCPHNVSQILKAVKNIKFHKSQIFLLKKMRAYNRIYMYIKRIP